MLRHESALQGNAHVRHLDWQEALDSESRAMSSGARGTESTRVAVDESNTKTAPKSGTQNEYDVILGTDILYEVCIKIIPKSGGFGDCTWRTLTLGNVILKATIM